MVSFHTSQTIQTLKQVSIVWSHIKDAMVEFMLEVRGDKEERHCVRVLKRRREHLLSLLGKYANTRPSSEIIPSDADVVALEPFNAEMHIPPPDDILSEYMDFNAALKQLTALSKQWRDSCLRILKPLLSEDRRTCRSPADCSGSTTSNYPSAITAPDLASLELATSFFSCKDPYCPDRRNSRVFTAHNLLAHPCMTRAPLRADEHDTRTKITVYSATRRGAVGTWHSGRRFMKAQQSEGLSGNLWAVCGADDVKRDGQPRCAVQVSGLCGGEGGAGHGLAWGGP